jgi:hypothetical protein
MKEKNEDDIPQWLINISFIQMIATINTPKAPFGVSLLHPVLIIQGYNQNYMKYIQTKYNFYLIPFEF